MGSDSDVPKRRDSPPLWYAALRGLGLGFLCFEILIFVALTLTDTIGPALGEWWGGLVSLPFFVAAFVLPISAIIATAVRASQPPSEWWWAAVVLYGLFMPVPVVAALEWFGFWGGEYMWTCLWGVTIASMAASGFALLPALGARAAEGESEVHLPVWWVAVALLAGLALGGLIYGALYYGAFGPPLSEEYFGVVLIVFPLWLLGTTVGCYAVVFMWRLSGRWEREPAGTP